jgi:uncharacterized phage protein (TIGR02216 family)
MKAADTGFPWARMMAIGFGILRLSPRDFWASTPREIAAALPYQASAQPLQRDDLDSLMQRFPDVT